MTIRHLSHDLTCAVLLCSAVAAAAEPAPLLDGMFTDHAVLQRDRPIDVWGEAAPGDVVDVALGDGSAHATADAAGHWRATLPAMKAGGPYSLTAHAASGRSQTISDVLVGDVWLCSGQSNMELPVTRTLGAAAETHGPVRDQIRLLSVAHAGSPTPLADFRAPVAWSVAGPDTVGSFSAVCYYFARALREHVDVPMGLVHSSWGGSAIEPWIGEAGLRSVPGFAERLDLLRLYAHDPATANQHMGAMWEAWWRTHDPHSEPWRGDDGSWQPVPEPMRDWKTWGVPETADLNGMIWFRRRVRLTPEQASQEARLSLGGIDEVDETWVNGRPVGNTFGWGTERTYTLPAGTLHAGDNVVVVNVLNTWAAGGMLGPDDHLALKLADDSSVPLAGGWEYQVVPTKFGYAPRAPWEPIAGLTTLRNAMITPIGSYGLRGALWYQGESNADAPGSYQALLSALMADWRSSFGKDLPFLVVQLPDFGTPPSTPVASGWADIREAQRRAVAHDAHAGLAVTIDIGERGELHPPDKWDVGRRLARAARHVVYGEDVTPSGPVPLEARRENGRVRVRFGEVQDQLVTYSSNHAIGFELCGSDPASCRFVTASIEGQQALLDPGSGAPATRVRFCWGDAPICNLYDGSGLPAGPFEIPIQ